MVKDKSDRAKRRQDMGIAGTMQVACESSIRRLLY